MLPHAHTRLAGDIVIKSLSVCFYENEAKEEECVVTNMLALGEEIFVLEVQTTYQDIKIAEKQLNPHR